MVIDSEFLDWCIRGVVAASFAGWAMVIRYFGGKYIGTMEEIQKELGVIRTEIAVLKARSRPHDDEEEA